jgi:tRNA modification GTPase
VNVSRFYRDRSRAVAAEEWCGLTAALSKPRMNRFLRYACTAVGCGCGGARFRGMLSFMKELAWNTDDLIYALATPWGESALAVIRTSGAGSVERVAEAFSSGVSLAASAGYSLHHGTLREPTTGEPVDEVVIAAYRKPRSYTGQDSVEIFCHGSIPGIQRVFDLLRSLGFRPAEGGEFTLRAFLSGRMDLTRAEAVHDIVTAKSRKAQALALHRLSGAVFERIRTVKNSLVELLASIEIRLDYPEDEVEEAGLSAEAIKEAETALLRLASSYREGKLYQEGVRIAIAGRTNAGKSSLFNLFLREDRSIVSDIHGTTRDYIESRVSIGGIPVRLYDTAGLRAPDNPVEEEGIRRSRLLVENAEIVLYVLDGAAGPDDEDRRFLDAHGIRFGGVSGRGETRTDAAGSVLRPDLAGAGTDTTEAGPGAPGTGGSVDGEVGDGGSVTGAEKIVAVWNKVDIASGPAPEGTVPLSAVTGEGLSRLEEEIGKRLLHGAAAAEGEPVIDSVRQKELLERAAASLAAVREGLSAGVPLDMAALDLRDAVNALGEITGEVTSADILNTMFSRFCVGK